METLTLNKLSKILKAQNGIVMPKKSVLMRKVGASLILLTTDLFMLSLAIAFSLVVRQLILPGVVHYDQYLSVSGIVLPLFSIAYYLRGLYPGFGVDVIEELRSLTYSTSVVYAILGLMTFIMQDSSAYSRIAFICSFVAALIIVPLGRAFVRKVFSKKDWWGIPVVVIGAGNAGERIIDSLSAQKHIGLRPVIAIDDDIDRWGYIKGVPVIGGLEVIPEVAKKICSDYAIIAMPKVPGPRQNEIIQKYSKYFSHTTVIPDMFGLSSLWVVTRDFGGILGLELQQKLLSKTSRIKKRIFDIILASILCIAVSPICLAVSLLIKLDSRGKIFFRQERMGIDDSRFKIIKFRTMHTDAEERLGSLLNSDKNLKKEYEIYHKLKNDPRLTRVGAFLRKFSLDELPQFWNVIKGDMSLIGPRAYIPWEKIKMNGQDEIILQVKPGISGLWQVTNRNQSSFEERNLMDVYYIRNWSMFLDIYIFARTIAVVVTGDSGC